MGTATKWIGDTKWRAKSQQCVKWPETLRKSVSVSVVDANAWVFMHWRSFVLVVSLLLSVSVVVLWLSSLTHAHAHCGSSLSLRSSHGHPHVSCARRMTSSTSPRTSSPISSSLLSSCSSCCPTASTSSPRTTAEELGTLAKNNSSTTRGRRNRDSTGSYVENTQESLSEQRFREDFDNDDITIGQTLIHACRRRADHSIVRSSDQDDSQGKKSDNKTCFENPQSCSWLVVRSNQLDPKIKIKYIDTKNQLADILLTKENFTRDEWNHLLCLFNISHFSSFNCSEVMSKWKQKDSGEERVTANSKPMRNLVSRCSERNPDVLASTASQNPVKTKYESQLPLTSWT